MNADRSRDTALLAIAVFLASIYLYKEFSMSAGPTQPINISSTKQNIIEIEGPSGVSKVYEYPKDKSAIEALPAKLPPHNLQKNGAKITINKDGSFVAAAMSGEKHLIFSIPLDINMAAAEDFEALPGIGPKLAERIVEIRERFGGFHTVGDLKKVKGVGDKKLNKLKTFIICKEAV